MSITNDEVLAGLKSFEERVSFMPPEMKYQDVLDVLGPAAESFVREALFPTLTLGETRDAMKRIKSHLEKLGVGT